MLLCTVKLSVPAANRYLQTSLYFTVEVALSTNIPEIIIFQLLNIYIVVLRAACSKVSVATLFFTIPSKQTEKKETFLPSLPSHNIQDNEDT